MILCKLTNLECFNTAFNALHILQILIVMVLYVRFEVINCTKRLPESPLNVAPGRIAAPTRVGTSLKANHKFPLT